MRKLDPNRKYDQPLAERSGSNQLTQEPISRIWLVGFFFGGNMRCILAFLLLVLPSCSGVGQGLDQVRSNLVLIRGVVEGCSSEMGEEEMAVRVGLVDDTIRLIDAIRNEKEGED